MDSLEITQLQRSTDFWGTSYSPCRLETEPMDDLATYRDDYVAAMVAYRKGEVKPMRSWNLPFLIRHCAFHTMDHAWEMQDKDLSGTNAAPR